MVLACVVGGPAVVFGCDTWCWMHRQWLGAPVLFSPCLAVRSTELSERFRELRRKGE